MLLQKVKHRARQPTKRIMQAMASGCISIQIIFLNNACLSPNVFLTFSILSLLQHRAHLNFGISASAGNHPLAQDASGKETAFSPLDQLQQQPLPTSDVVVQQFCYSQYRCSTDQLSFCHQPLQQTPVSIFANISSG